MESIVKVLGITTKPPFRQALVLVLLPNINKTFAVHKACRGQRCSPLRLTYINPDDIIGKIGFLYSDGTGGECHG